jgi:hypothetical protein
MAKIPVIFITGQVGNIHGYTLDHLILKNEVAAFRRSEGWVLIGCDPIRNAQQPLMKSRKRWNDFPSKKPPPSSHHSSVSWCVIRDQK